MTVEETDGRILLIEDDYGNRILLTDYLRYCGYTVLALEDGTDALSAVSSFQPQVILLDLKLPTMSGLSVIETLQQDARFCHIPILVISGYAFQADQQKAIQLGAIRYLVKPVQPEVLLAAIQAVL
ncbi:MAG: response regulator [Leptolyngbya sp. SIO4C1]|nr:response regulator [Leptolyngbya sp. SIO4C1]